MNLWATWCVPCRAEMPMLDQFDLAHRASGVTVVGLSADRGRDRKSVTQVASSVHYPVALLAESKPDELDQPRALPITYIVDRSGVVRYIFDGSRSPLTKEKLAQAISALPSG